MKTPKAFNDFFESVYGDRWSQLLQSMRKGENQVRRSNLFLKAQKVDESCEIPDSLWHEKSEEIPRDVDDGLLTYYVLDPASVIVAESLGVGSGEKVLDMCAAPGGKSLILAQRLFAESSAAHGELTLNEISAARRDRLTKVVQNYIPRAIRDHVWVTGKDGATFGRKTPGEFDKILLDAPCSGERHLLANEEELGKWSKSRTERLAQQQYSLLCSGVDALKIGGELIYSTCSISPLENDGVIDKFFKKRGDSIAVVPVDIKVEGAEKTKWGWQFLPDQCGYGPMYFVKIRKLL